MSAKMSTLGLLKIMVFRNKGYDVITSVYDLIKHLSRDSNYIVDVVIWPKFGDSSTSVTSIIALGTLQVGNITPSVGFDLRHCKSLYCQNYGQGKIFTRFMLGKSIFRLRTSNYDGNIYSYQSSYLQTQKECITFGKCEGFLKVLTLHEWMILLLDLIGRLFFCSISKKFHIQSEDFERDIVLLMLEIGSIKMGSMDVGFILFHFNHST